MLCQRSFPRKLAFCYLQDLAKQFHQQYGKDVERASRPYAFVAFGQFSIASLSPLPPFSLILSL